MPSDSAPDRAGRRTRRRCQLAGSDASGCWTLLLLNSTLLSKPSDVARLSAGMFTVSYTVAVTVSVLSGASWDLTGKVASVFVPMAAAVLPMVLLTATIPMRRREAAA